MSEDYTKPIECKVCGRITFDQDAKICEIVPQPLIAAFTGEKAAATGCGWPLVDDPEAFANAYGFDALVQTSRGERIEIHRKGKAARVKTAAKCEGKLLALRPLTKTQWINAYGEGAM